MGNTREQKFCSKTSGQSRLRVERTCNMLIHLLIIGFSLSSSTAGDQKFTELKKISEEDGEGRLMRLRTCRDKFMVQCELCEVIRIVNVSHAVSELLQRNGRDGCSDVSFQREFDCLQPSNSQYLEEIEGRCNENQSCELSLGSEAINCSNSVRTESCCVDIFYTCKPRKSVMLSSLFMANDSAGNAYASLQCQSSDLSIQSVVLAFNSSGEFHEGGVCYKLSPNKEHIARNCDKKKCSSVLVSGARGCGGNTYINNFGAYIYYTCRSGHLNHCQRTITATTDPSPMTQTMNTTTALPTMTQTVTTTTAPQPMTQTMTATTAPPTMTQTVTATTAPPTMTQTVTATTASPTMTQTMTATTALQPISHTSNRWIIVGVLLVVAAVVILVVGFIICAKRRQKAKIGKEPTGTAFPQKLMASFRATRESRGGTTSQMERKECSYPGIASMAGQGYELDNSEYCEINDLEREVVQRGTDSKRDRDDRTNRGTDEGEGRIETNADLYAYTEPQKVQWQDTHDDADNRGSNQNIIYAEVADSKNDLELVYYELEPLGK